MKTIIKTWQIEACIVFSILVLVNIFTGHEPKEWLGTFAVLFTFLHAQIAERLSEKEAAKLSPEVNCYHYATRYFLTKEVLWFFYFLLSGTYSALVGVCIFLVYPFWRKWYRGKKPMIRDMIE